MVLAPERIGRQTERRTINDIVPAASLQRGEANARLMSASLPATVQRADITGGQATFEFQGKNRSLMRADDA
ncbi:hypothetical protein [Bradyrhizobium commune]|uniref:Uncharacterized protein n=1 Tax=Bradyrhizobium commune TaxID=83627 RepID=A0A7S9GYQ7_9BRAD|nr:hypothetical protein [Bradyrhizobium commune]QPF90106.1 hypothetical protein IC761_26885 [Bradyrhizobium commune]